MAPARRHRWLSAGARAAAAAIPLALAEASAAGAITFNTALPVGDDVFVARVQAIHRQRGDDVPGGREVEIDGGVAALGYGITADWTGIAIASYLDKTLTVTSAGRTVRRRAQGVGDTTLLARYSAFERNAPGRLLRIKPVFGVIAPTGAADERDARGEVPAPLQPGAGSWGGVVGVLVTRQTLEATFDTALTATTRGRHEGFEPGDEIELAGSYQYRLPWPGRGTGAFTYALVEGKVIRRGDDVVAGERVDNGGLAARIVPGLQYVTRRWVVEAAVELPLADGLPRKALRDRRFVHLGVRFNF